MSTLKLLSVAVVSLLVSFPALALPPALTIVEEEPKADPTQLIQAVVTMIVAVIVVGGIFYWGTKKFGKKN